MDVRSLSYEGPFDVEQEHELDGVLQQAIESYEAAAVRFSMDALGDAAARQNYMKNIQRISREVLTEVDLGRMSVKEGAEFCQQMRNRIMAETRAITSPQGLAAAVRMKKEGRSLESLLNNYSDELFGKHFSSLTETDKSKVYYTIIEAAGRDKASVTAGTRHLQMLGKVGLLSTATLGIYFVWIADNRVKESIRQTVIMSGGAAGGVMAGAAVSTVCGPGAPACAVALVLLGSIGGGFIAEKTVDLYDEELEEFTRW